MHSELVRPRLEHCVQGWAPHWQGTVTNECVQRRATGMVRGLKTTSYKECLRALATLSFEKS